MTKIDVREKNGDILADYPQLKDEQSISDRDRILIHSSLIDEMREIRRNQGTWLDILSQYAYHSHIYGNTPVFAIINQTETDGGIQSIYRKAKLEKLEKSKVVEMLKIHLRIRQALDAVHFIKHGEYLDGQSLIPEGFTHRQIVDLIQSAPDCMPTHNKN